MKHIDVLCGDDAMCRKNIFFGRVPRPRGSLKPFRRNHKLVLASSFDPRAAPKVYNPLTSGMGIVMDKDSLEDKQADSERKMAKFRAKQQAWAKKYSKVDSPDLPKESRIESDAEQGMQGEESNTSFEEILDAASFIVRLVVVAIAWVSCLLHFVPYIFSAGSLLGALTSLVFMLAMMALVHSLLLPELIPK